MQKSYTAFGVTVAHEARKGGRQKVSGSFVGAGGAAFEQASGPPARAANTARLLGMQPGRDSFLQSTLIIEAEQVPTSSERGTNQGSEPTRKGIWLQVPIKCGAGQERLAEKRIALAAE